VGARARLLILGVIAIVSAAAGMRAHHRLDEMPLEAAPVLAPVPPPEGLLADGVMPSPEATWRKAQAAIGGALMLAPPTLGGILAAFAHVPQLTTIVDGQLPAYVVLGDHERWVVAAHVVTPTRARSTLVGREGEVGFKLTSQVEGVDLLRDENNRWLGLSGPWVLVGSDRDAIAVLGPYAYRTLPTREPRSSAASGTITSAGLVGLRPELASRWKDFEKFLLDKDDEQRRAHGGRAPDLADPKPLVAAADALATRYIDIVTGMASVDVALDVVDEAASARITMMPPSAQDSAAHRWVQGLKGAPPSPLRVANADAAATIFWHTEVSDRETTAGDLASLVGSALGTRVPQKDMGHVLELISHTPLARGSWATASVMTTPSLGALLRWSTSPCVQTAPDGGRATTGAATLNASIEGLIDVLRKPSWSAWEKDGLSMTKVDRTGEHATFDTTEARVQASWAGRDGELDLAVGLDAAAVLGTASPTRTFDADAKIGPWLRGLGEEVVWAIAARPLLLGRSAHPDPGCLALAKGKGVAELRARVSAAVLRGP
jgi:hypothetical protein